MPLAQMRVNHHRLNVFVAQEALDRGQRNTDHGEVAGEGVTESVQRCGTQTSESNEPRDVSLQCALGNRFVRIVEKNLGA